MEPTIDQFELMDQPRDIHGHGGAIVASTSLEHQAYSAS